MYNIVSQLFSHKLELAYVSMMYICVKERDWKRREREENNPVSTLPKEVITLQ